MNLLYIHRLSFYKSYYASILSAFQDLHKPVPIYMRIHVGVDHLAHFLSIDASNIIQEEVDDSKRIPHHKQHSLCFEQVLLTSRQDDDKNRRNRYPLSEATANKFRQTAYRLIKPPISKNGDRFVDYWTAGQPIVVTYAHRSSRDSRHAGNVLWFANHLRNLLPKSQFIIHVTPTPNSIADHVEQMRIVYHTNVLITEHGAFDSNVICMRNGSLFIQLRGGHGNLGCIHDYKLAYTSQVFGVFYKVVINKDMTEFGKQEFSITLDEANTVVEIILSYAANATYVYRSIS